MLLYSCRQERRIKHMEDDEKRLNAIMQSKTWQDIRKDAKVRASRKDGWKWYEKPENKGHFANSITVMSAKSSLVDQELNVLFGVYNVNPDYIESERIPSSDAIKLFQELFKKIQENPAKYDAWKNEN